MTFVFLLVVVCVLRVLNQVSALTTGCTQGSDQNGACCSGEIELDPTITSIAAGAFKNCY